MKTQKKHTRTHAHTQKHTFTPAEGNMSTSHTVNIMDADGLAT